MAQTDYIVMAGTIIISGSMQGSPTSPTLPIGPLTLTLPGTIESILLPAMIAGNNGPFAVPAGALYALIIPPATNISLLTLKGATIADVGIPMLRTGPSLIGLDPTTTILNILSAGPVPLGTTISFYG